MKNQNRSSLSKLFFLITFFTLSVNAQISFEKGYYIDNLDNKISCFIKNIDWKNNPTEFEYKLLENSEIKLIKIKYVKEFRVLSGLKYIRSAVDIDRSNENMNQLSKGKEPIFNEETLFLKVLIEGKANLYLYEDRNLTRFFYNVDTNNIKQLIYKTYLYENEYQNNIIAKNNKFRNQLWVDLKCPTIKMSKVENLDYYKKDLKRFFTQYNNCKNGKNINYEEKASKKDLFNLSLRAGFNNSSFSMQNSNDISRDVSFDNETAFRFGIEAEYIFPYNKNKWSVILEPKYQSYTSESETQLPSQTVTVDYTSIEIPLGIRHYFFINDTSKIFINASYIFDKATSSKIDFETSSDLEIVSRNNLAFGFGYKYNDKYSAELRYHTGRELLSNLTFWSSEYNTISFILGYSIF